MYEEKYISQDSASESCSYIYIQSLQQRFREDSSYRSNNYCYLQVDYRRQEQISSRNCYFFFSSGRILKAN